MGKNVITSTLPNIGQNYLPKVNTSNIFANSLVYDDGSSVLINTTTASAFKLDVNGSIRATSGTLTGALSGTSATFSGNVVLGTTALSGGGAAQWLTANGTAYGGGFISSVNGVAKAYYYYDNGGYAYVQGESGAGVRLVVNSSTNALTIATTGAATFSSSVTANGTMLLNANTTGNGYITIDHTGGSGGHSWQWFTHMTGNDIPGGMGFYDVTASAYRFVITGGGNIGIGTNSPAALLDTQTNSSTGNILNSSADVVARFGNINTNPGNHNSTGIQVYQGSGTLGSGYAAGFLVTDNNTAIAQQQNTLSLISPASMTGGVNIIAADTSATIKFYTGSFTSERMRIGSDGIFYYGTTTYNSALKGILFNPAGYAFFTVNSDKVMYLNRLTNDGVILEFQKNTTSVGSISTNTYSLPSDFNFKKNINNLELGLNFISKLRPVSYNHKIDDNDAALSTGFIAQEMEEILNDLGIEKNSYYILQHKPNNDKKQSQYWLDYTKMIPVLTKAIQELKAELDTLKK